MWDTSVIVIWKKKSMDIGVFFISLEFWSCLLTDLFSENCEAMAGVENVWSYYWVWVKKNGGCLKMGRKLFDLANTEIQLDTASSFNSRS